MGLKDFVGKVAQDALGRIVAASPQKLTSATTGIILAKREVCVFTAEHIKTYLRHVGQILYNSTRLSSDVGGRLIHVGGDLFVLYRSRWPILLTANSKDFGPAVYYPRMMSIDLLLEEAFLFNRRAPRIIRTSQYATSYRSSTNDNSTTLWPTFASSAVVDRIKQWNNSKIQCKKLGLPWRSGLLLYGGSGNGKTKAVEAACRLNNIDLASLSISGSEDSFQQAWDAMTSLGPNGETSPRVILIEDLDDTIRGRDNVKSPSGLSFSTLLNLIDGAASADGVFVVVTTNCLEHVDPALGRPVDETNWNCLSTRPGRLDRCIRFDDPTPPERAAIAQLHRLDDAEVEDVVAATEGHSVAQLAAVCRERVAAMALRIVEESATS